ncbi:MAG: GAF domain-containing protein [Nitrosopumilus sp.]|nr:GAF domain-containing protein [Nitrosopumilus sp.]MDH3737039.1 GAF domain-containing protein [Nitrosopumilus sp.]MDH3823911.1 GAF domain-containing protein [Nitrosopumilus sp.]MDH3834844.1 GAF domain-containing protein [Nitrosopumilus sp.]
MTDEIDKIILAHLGKNARISSQDIATNLQDLGYTITDRAVRQRFARLEKNNVILGYSAILNPSLISEKVNRTIILKFKLTKKTEALVELLTKYVEESIFCTYSSKLSGDFDWICHFVFDSVDQFDLESNNFLSRFGELISDYRSYESKMIKSSPYMVYDEQELKEKKLRVYSILNSLKIHDSLNDRLQAIVDSLVTYFDGYFARLWFVDKDRKWLILKFSSGKYKNIDGEFSKVSIDSLKIGPVVKTRKAVVTNDVAHDPRVKHHDWAKKEKLQSFAAYPLTYKGKSIAVLALFSKKKLSHIDFEILGIFCDQLSKELTGFFEAKDFLSE